ncbi:hypothetical protein [Streptomyces sp. NPDC058773]|uniref:effector-associated constant component EACC1 n=1 Tax=Streptomyces sp. NPDC058773 TaxID=3346632 RepID=UPI0036BAE9F3
MEGINLVGNAASLCRWLITDPELRGLAEVSIAPVHPGQGHRRGALELVNVALGNAIALSNILVAVAAWRESRPHEAQVRLESNGVIVTLQGTSPEVVDQILESRDTDDSGRGPEADRGDRD